MRRNLFFYESLMFFVSNALLFILHDAYEETNIYILSFISAINESVYEHLKITFFALFLVYVVEYFLIGKLYDNYCYSRFVALLIAPLIVMVGYYTYSGILGYHVLWLDILIGIIAIFIAQTIAYKILNNNIKSKLSNQLWFIIILILVIIFSLFTYNPPKIDLFKDNQTGQYGI
ncbi:MAG: DUF6512 family protein [Eubacteriales bacterium]